MVRVLGIHHATPDVVVVEGDLGLARDLGSHATDLGLVRVEPKRAVKVEHREFEVVRVDRFKGVLVALRTHLLTTEGQEALPHPGSKRVDEFGALAARLLDQLVGDDLGGDHEDDLPPADRVVVSAEGGTDDRDVAEKRNLAVRDRRLFLEEAAQHQRLSVADLDVGRDLVREFVGDLHESFRDAHGERAEFRAGDAGIELHPDGVVLRDEGPEHQLHTGVEILHGLGRGGVGRGRRKVGDPLADHDLRPLTVERHDPRSSEHHGVGDLIERSNEHRGVTRDESDLEVALAVRGLAGRGLRAPRRAASVVGGGAGAAVGRRGAAEKIRHRTERGDQLGDVEIAHDREVDTEGVVLRDLDARDGRIDHDLPWRGVDLTEEFGDPVELVGIVVDHENRRLGPVVPAHVAEVSFDSAGDLADEAQLAPVREKRGREFTRVPRGEVLEFEHAALGLAIEGLHASELLLGVDVDELAFFDPSESVRLQDGVQRLLEGDVEEIRADHRRDVPTRDDVPLALEGEHLKHLREIGVGDLDVEGVELVDFDAAEIQRFVGRDLTTVLAEPVLGGGRGEEREGGGGGHEATGDAAD